MFLVKKLMNSKFYHIFLLSRENNRFFLRVTLCPQPLWRFLRIKMEKITLKLAIKLSSFARFRCANRY